MLVSHFNGIQNGIRRQQSRRPHNIKKFGCSAVVQSLLTVTLNSSAQVILPPQPAKYLGLK
ncbi:hypothetical protein AAY473_006107, partial [Plecturocebus cupreus]